jgi:hypothetical protein
VLEGVHVWDFCGLSIGGKETRESEKKGIRLRRDREICREEENEENSVKNRGKKDCDGDEGQIDGDITGPR